jgi:signal transduction histidine kinase/CheY-like chemotaxis protein/AraC-like DNA-binding protein/sugar lactone lactonase YvrE
MKLIVPVAYFTILFNTLALSAQVRMESLTVADGLSQGFVTSIIQDEKGFLWMGTYDGLNRYDGYAVKQFKPKPFDSLSIQSSFITAIHEDLQHYLWIGTTEGLYLFDPLKEHFYYLSDVKSPFAGQSIELIAGDTFGNIFVQAFYNVDSIEIYRLHLPPYLSKKIAAGGNPKDYIPIDKVTPPATLKRGLQLIGYFGDSLLLAKDKSDRYFKYSNHSRQFYPFDLKKLPANATLDHNILWGKNLGFIFRQQTPSGITTILPKDRWIKVLRMGNGRIGAWFSPHGPFVVINENKPILDNLNLPKHELVSQDYFQKIFTILYSDSANQNEPVGWNDNLLVDRSGLLWISTGGWGLRKINPRQISFGKFLLGKSISSLQELPDGRLWVRLYSDESFVLNPSTGKVEPAPWASALGEKSFYQVFASRENNYWVIESEFRFYPYNELYLYEKAGNKVTSFEKKIPFVRSVPEKILQDKDGNIWIAGHQGTLFRCRPGQYVLDDFSYAYLTPDNNKNILRSTAITQDLHGTIWIGTNRGVVYVENANSAAPVFSMLQHNRKNRNSISTDWVTSICPDPQYADVLWFGTHGGGLNRLHTPSKTFTFWTQSSNGLPDNVVYGILPDGAGNLWCSTNRGICRFSYSQNTFNNYLESDGLSSTEFNTNSYLRTKDGRLWFGGVSGLNVFRPEDIVVQNAAPLVAITGIKVRGVERFPDTEGVLSLYFAENNVLFEFTALDYANPATNRFRHRLKGIDRDWVYDGSVHNANYSALPPGKYVFELQGATADSPWSDRTETFTLIVKAPWYRSVLAYCCYIIFLIAAIFGIIRYREQIYKLENSAALNQRESERLKEFEALKNQFFANIAHELRTPLTVIQGLSDRLRRGVKGDSVQESAQKILKQSDQLLQLTDQMLDLARLESLQFQLQLQKGDFIDFIRHHTNTLVPLANSKGVRLDMALEPKTLWFEFDRSQLQKILNNLISNAIRHTPSGGNILVKCTQENNSVCLSVVDNGEGIAQEDLPHIFDRFFQSSKPDHAVGASGLGLTLTRDLVRLMGGSIQVESTPGAGSVFSINLPLNELSPQIPDETATSVHKFNTRQENEPSAINKADLPLLLILEDNEDVLQYLCLCLHPYFKLATATNGAEGIKKAFELIPDLVLTDVAMPQKNGYEVTTILKSDERTSHIPIAMLTAKVESGDRMEGHRRGANAYLTKPFEESELLLVLHNLMHLQQQWQYRYANLLKEPENLYAIDQAPEDVQVEDNFIIKVTQIFEAEYMDDSFNLDRLCRMLNMSSSQIDRKIKALINQSPMQMLRSFRLQKAKTLLRTEPHISIKEVCFRTGFKSPSHFSRLYSKEFGAPPSEG